MNFNLVFRHRNPKNFSIESIFQNLLDHLSIDQKNIKKIELPFLSNSKASLLKNLKYAAKLDKNQIYHITGDVHYTTLVLPKNKTLLTIHDCVTLTKKRNFFNQLLIKKLWYDWPVKAAKYITVISEKTKKELIEHTGCSEEKIKVIPNFYDPIFKYHEKKINTARPKILQIGTRDNKNLERLIPALEVIPCELLIVGELTEEQLSLLKQYQIDYKNHINIPKEELYQLYVACDLVAFVSTYEGFGMPIIEAQAVGRPVITSNIPPMIDVAGKGAYLVDPYEVNSIKEVIVNALSDDNKRENVLKKASENVEKYTIDRIAHQYLDLYNQLSAS